MCLCVFITFKTSFQDSRFKVNDLLKQLKIYTVSFAEEMGCQVSVLLPLSAVCTKSWRHCIFWDFVSRYITLLTPHQTIFSADTSAFYMQVSFGLIDL